MKTLYCLTIFLVCVTFVMSLERKTYLKCGEYLAVNEFLESTNGYYAVMQSDCNFVIYNNGIASIGNALWNTGTSSGTKCYNLIMQNDGNLVLYTSDYKAVWSTKTNA